LAYNWGIFKKKALPGFVISLGNLNAGGTGKTPAAIMMAGWAFKEGYRVAVLSRGHGGRYKKRVLEVSDGNSIKTDSTECGDEPYLLAKKLQGIPVIVSRKRFLGGLFAHTKFGCDFFILDDGLQHLELRRDLNLVLIDAENPFGNGHLLPWGPLREPVHQLARADAYILTRVTTNVCKERVSNFLKKNFPSAPVFHAKHHPGKIVFPHSDQTHKPEFLNKKRVVAFAGIAEPEAFKGTLIDLGTDLVYFRSFRDHYRFRNGDIHTLIQVKERLGAQYILTTEKDWVRIPSNFTNYHYFGYLVIQFTLLSGQDDFFNMIKDGINKRRNTG
jgi:tetraacyldisaccharide 4'-kinase